MRFYYLRFLGKGLVTHVNPKAAIKCYSNSIVQQPAHANPNAAIKCYSNSIIQQPAHKNPNAAIKCYSNSIIQQLPTPSSSNLPIKT